MTETITVSITGQKLTNYYWIEAYKDDNLWVIPKHSFQRKISTDVIIYPGNVYLKLLFEIADKDWCWDFEPNETVILEILSGMNNKPESDVILKTNFIHDVILWRSIERMEYSRIINYAIESSKLPTSSDTLSPLLQVSNNFDSSYFLDQFPLFKEFIDRSKNLNLMISGSSVLYSTKDIKLNGYAADVDIYMHQAQDQKVVLKTLDFIIRDIYKNSFEYYDKYNEETITVYRTKITLVRSPYILSWLVVTDDDKRQLLVSYQVILSPCQRWEHVFSGYHSDIVCSGYLTQQQCFVESTRFSHWYSGNSLTNLRQYYPQALKHSKEKRLAFFLPDLVSPRYRDRVVSAYHKYNKRGLLVAYVAPFDEINMADVARSEIPWHDSFSVCHLRQVDICPTLASIHDKEKECCVGETLHSVYNGEKFRSIIETMACFQSCPGCNTLVFNAKNTMYSSLSKLNERHVVRLYSEIRTDKGCFCEECHTTELDKIQELQQTIKSLDSTNYKTLVTGGRCGLGQKVLELLRDNGLTQSFGTSRFPATDDLLKLDLKNPGTWTDVKNLLENGEINLLVLSASETLHYPGDDEKSSQWKSDVTSDVIDWTNDYKRENSGVWHKCLDQHSYEEIVSPLMANVAGSAALLGYFLSGVKRMRAIGNNKHFCCIVVTSYEGRFEEKTPFHPITNACKSALEQIVWTVKEQADFLDCHVLMADPGWVYTEGSFGKIKGPVPIEFGACQILQPFIHSLKQTTGNAQLFRRAGTIKPLMSHYPSTTIKIRLIPCNHVVQQLDKAIEWCPVCSTRTKSRELVNVDVELTPYKHEDEVDTEEDDVPRIPMISRKLY